MERPADVLPMDKANPPRLGWFTRLDMALRRMPGLGVIIVAVLIQSEWERGNLFGFVVLSTCTFFALLLEFAPKHLTTGSSPRLSEGPYARPTQPHRT